MFEHHLDCIQVINDLNSDGTFILLDSELIDSMEFVHIFPVIHYNHNLAVKLCFITCICDGMFHEYMQELYNKESVKWRQKVMKPDYHCLSKGMYKPTSVER